MDRRYATSFVHQSSSPKWNYVKLHVILRKYVRAGKLFCDENTRVDSTSHWGEIFFEKRTKHRITLNYSRLPRKSDKIMGYLWICEEEEDEEYVEYLECVFGKTGTACNSSRTCTMERRISSNQRSRKKKGTVQQDEIFKERGSTRLDRKQRGVAISRVHPLAEGLARVLKQYPPVPRVSREFCINDLWKGTIPTREKEIKREREREREREKYTHTHTRGKERKPRRDYYGFACSECPRFRAECSREHCLRRGSFSFDGNGGKTMGRAASLRSLYYKR